MSDFTAAGADLLMTWAFTTTAVTRPTTWFVALHTDDPGVDGSANEVLVANDAGYIRKAVTFDDPIDASGVAMALSNAQVSWTVDAGSSGYTVTHASIWDAETGGMALMKSALMVPRTLAASGVLTFNVGEVVAALD